MILSKEEKKKLLEIEEDLNGISQGNWIIAGEEDLNEEQKSENDANLDVNGLPFELELIGYSRGLREYIINMGSNVAVTIEERKQNHTNARFISKVPERMRFLLDLVKNEITLD